jgi:hypothetical protein
MRGLYPVHARHGYIHDHHVGTEFLNLLDSLLAVAGLRHHLHVGLLFQQGPESLTKYPMVIAD